MKPSTNYRISQEDVEERAAAAFLGFAIGDALGATAEFMTPSEIRAEFGVLKDIRGGGWLRLPPGAITDDTEMSLCIARSIAEVGFSPEDIAKRFTAWLKTRPRDIGGTCRRGIRRYMVDGSLYASPSDMDAGNGAAMRMVPIALATLGDTNALVRCAIRQAHITHNNTLSDAACVFLGQILHLALAGHSKARLKALTDDFLRHFPTFGYDKSSILSSAYVVDTIRTVLHSFFAARNLEESIVATVNWGGDADTAGAIVGAIAGAYYGYAEIPQHWLAKLDPFIRREVERLSRALVARSPVADTSRQLELPRHFVRDLLEFEVVHGA